MSQPAENDIAMIEKLRTAHQRLRQEIGKVIVGQDAVLDQLLMAIFCRSHALLVGVPGLAKTLMVSTLAQALDMTFKRIQFTPDLMPTDITGTEVIQDDPATGQRMFKFLHGDDILRLQHVIRRVPVADHIFAYAKRLTRISRPNTPEAADFVNKWLTWGAGPRASLNLILAAKAHAVLNGRFHVGADDV